MPQYHHHGRVISSEPIAHIRPLKSSKPFGPKTLLLFRVNLSLSKMNGNGGGGRPEAGLKGQCGSGSGQDTFWTICPSCYYAYEYPRVYEECCLRCQNQSCGRAFQAVVIQSPPPPAVVQDGHYTCLGFYPIGFEVGGKGFSSWTPFGPTSMGTGQEKGEEKTDVPKGGNNGVNTDCFVEISDASDDEFMGESNGENLQTEVLKNGSGVADNTCKTGVTGGVKPVLRRKKTVAKNTKKVMGKGVRVKIHKTVDGNCEGMEMDSESGENDGNLGCGIANAGGVEMGSWGDSLMDVCGVLPDGF